MLRNSPDQGATNPLLQEGRSPMIRVMVVDDHDFVRAQLVALLGTCADIEVVGQCSAGEQVVDTRRPGGTRCSGDGRADGGDVRVSRDPRVAGRATNGAGTGADRVSHGDSPRRGATGASGLIRKSGNPGDLLAAVRTIAAGGTCWPRKSAP